MQHSSITLEVYFRKFWKLLLPRLHHSDDIRAKSYVRIILGHPIDCVLSRCVFADYLIWDCVLCQCSRGYIPYQLNIFQTPQKRNLGWNVRGCALCTDSVAWPLGLRDFLSNASANELMTLPTGESGQRAASLTGNGCSEKRCRSPVMRCQETSHFIIQRKHSITDSIAEHLARHLRIFSFYRFLSRPARLVSSTVKWDYFCQPAKVTYWNVTKINKG